MSKTPRLTGNLPFVESPPRCTVRSCSGPSSLSSMRTRCCHGSSASCSYLDPNCSARIPAWMRAALKIFFYS